MHVDAKHQQIELCARELRQMYRGNVVSSSMYRVQLLDCHQLTVATRSTESFYVLRLGQP
ncbi:uncharacterized protein PHALS_14729 [Plasmopara halstedii]|uniref:Uncharacterized protein n=1 Tax=Plasmopara halstedii TaxID=4781 RepID=A0A0P1A3U7_PLAHL|nr:uncharacterized protein PHALS_14729 [Plasmopara halstedii]CEG35146.1 hypothetical protein PHALS_14729 [Plasmopara halstedii]|eukprot:XP_024571515.1 hypothetical protein PHALS_14729 [Plasmopara halstedii]